MSLDRREFMAAAASFAAASAMPPSPMRGVAPGASLLDDPLGVRADFPIVAARTYLNGAYSTPSPRQGITAAQAFVEGRAGPVLVGDLLRKAGEVRAQFARLVNASPDEIGFVYATTEGENGPGDAWRRHYGDFHQVGAGPCPARATFTSSGRGRAMPGPGDAWRRPYGDFTS